MEGKGEGGGRFVAQIDINGGGAVWGLDWATDGLRLRAMEGEEGKVWRISGESFQTVRAYLR